MQVENKEYDGVKVENSTPGLNSYEGMAAERSPGHPAPTNDSKPIESTKNPLLDKVLKEKKNAMTRNYELQNQLESMKVQMSQFEEDKMMREKNFEQLADQRKQEVEDWKEKYHGSQNLIEKSIKTGSLKNELSKLGVRPERLDVAMKMVDINKLQYDKETQTVLGAEDIASDLSSQLPEWFGQEKIGVNQAAPQSPMGPLDMESWKRLPNEERQKRLPELYKNMGLNYRK